MYKANILVSHIKEKSIGAHEGQRNKKRLKYILKQIQALLVIFKINFSPFNPILFILLQLINEMSLGLFKIVKFERTSQEYLTW